MRTQGQKIAGYPRRAALPSYAEFLRIYEAYDSANELVKLSTLSVLIPFIFLCLPITYVATPQTAPLLILLGLGAITFVGFLAHQKSLKLDGVLDNRPVHIRSLTLTCLIPVLGTVIQLLVLEMMASKLRDFGAKGAQIGLRVKPAEVYQALKAQEDEVGDMSEPPTLG